MFNRLPKEFYHNLYQHLFCDSILGMSCIQYTSSGYLICPYVAHIQPPRELHQNNVELAVALPG